MVESELHCFLKKVGVAYLLNRGCFLVGTEVPISRFGQTLLHDLDGHRVIDVCGVGERFFKLGETQDGDAHSEDYEVALNILRGIEVKVSRSDFRNGFVCSGCNYNYLLTPMRLVSPSELPRGVGLIEYNRYKFSVELKEEGEYSFKGLRVVRRPSFAMARQHQIDNATTYIARRTTGDKMREFLEELAQDYPDTGNHYP